MFSADGLIWVILRGDDSIEMAASDVVDIPDTLAEFAPIDVQLLGLIFGFGGSGGGVPKLRELVATE